MPAYKFAGRYGPEALVDLAGNALVTNSLTTTSVLVKTTAGTTAALYTDKNKTAAASNPTTTDAKGNLAFYVTPGDYDLVATVAGVQQPAVRVTVGVDPGEIGPTAKLNPAAPPYNAAGDKVTDDADAFASVFADALASKVTSPSFPGSNTNRFFQTAVDIPAGVYVITDPAAFLTAVSSMRTMGLRFRGAGRFATAIHFQPSSPNSYLLDNEDYYGSLAFEDLTFICNDPTSSFMKSVSNGGAQNYAFNRVNWQGSWKYGLDLQGGNNNSEMSWYHCGVYGEWSDFLYSAAGGSDQFVNYNFFGCNIEYSAGDFIDMSKGGNINVWGGSLIHLGNGSAAQAFFRFPIGDHAYGAQRLFVAGTRVEHRHLLSQLINSKWKRGNITFQSVDTETYQSTVSYTVTDLISAEFDASNHGYPEIVFDGCSLMGKHRYTYHGSNYDYARRVRYRGCEITSFPDAHSFIDTANPDATGNLGGSPPIEFDGCRGNVASSYKRPFDCTVNWQWATSGAPRRRAVSIKRPDGQSPYSSAPTQDVILPLNAVITKVRFHKGNSGSSTATTWSYTLTDADGATIASASGGGTLQWRFGFDIDSGDLWARCTTDNKRTLTLTSANITQTAGDLFVIIEYLA